MRNTIAQDRMDLSACSLEGPNNCQAFDGATGRTLSDRSVASNGRLAADDFVPQSDTLQSLCVWGQYINHDPHAPEVDCASVAAADSFRVRVLANGSDLPDSPSVWSWATSTRTPAFLNRDTTDSTTIYKFELVLDTPITGLITDGRGYWLEVSNWSSNSESYFCYWHWSQLSTDSVAGNRYSAKGNQSGYVSGDERPVDHAFCLDMDIAAGGMGPVMHPCCHCDGSCEPTTLTDCDQMGGSWNVTLDTCASASCPSGPPANDTCSMMQAVDAGIYQFDTTCAGTELASPVQTEWGAAVVGKDVWFSYYHECGCILTFYTCLSHFDTVLALYFDPDNPDVCPCPTDENLESFLIASDETCLYGLNGGGGRIQLGTDAWNVAPLGCYTIRVGGFEGDSGMASLNIICAQPESFFSRPPPGVSASPPDKTRFISLSFAQGREPCVEPGEYAIRVKLTSLHHVDPPYSGGPSIPFTAFEGQVRWVSPPVQFVESPSSGFGFLASSLQCHPYYRDWSTIGLLHVTGSAIVPSSIYEIQTFSSSCFGNEETCSDVSSPIVISTTRWGDVETPYNPPDATVQPNITDVSALVNKFRNAPGAPIKARAILAGAPGNPFGEITPAVLNVDLSFSHISACVDAFRGLPYPYTILSCP